MKTKVRKQGDTAVIEMGGKLSVESSTPMKENLSKIIDSSKTDSVPTKIIFNLKDLEFVGSSGISAFVQTLKDFNQQAPVRPRYCNVRSEFRKIIKAFDEGAEFTFFDSEESAKKSFDQ